MHIGGVIIAETDPLTEIYRSLPPGLELPMANEPTEPYQIEHFEPKSLDDLTRYGAFMVALMVWSAGTGETERTSFMPTYQDFDAMYAAGYGVSSDQLQSNGTERRPGIRRVQRALKFYPFSYRPDEEELRHDLKALADHADFAPGTHVKDIHSWAWARDLLPSRNMMFSVMTNPSEVRNILSTEKLLGEQLTLMDLYQLGAKVLRENDGRPPTRDELDERYSDAFAGGKPSTAIKVFFGTYRRFWQEFDLIVDSSGMSEQEAVSIGVRHAIATGDSRISHTRAKRLASDNKLPLSPLRRIGYVRYQEMIDADYAVYQELCEQLEPQGVTAEAMQVVCFRTFEPTAEFGDWLQQHADILKRLSGSRAAFLRDRIRNGFDLTNQSLYQWQLKEAHKILDGWQLDEDQKRFVLDLVPRYDTDGVMASMPAPKDDDDDYHFVVPHRTTTWGRANG